jgi:cysteinyl-tRNA synthetase
MRNPRPPNPNENDGAPLSVSLTFGPSFARSNHFVFLHTLFEIMFVGHQIIPDTIHKTPTMKTTTRSFRYHYWIFATAVSLSSVTAWTGSTINRNRTPCSLLRMSNSESESESESEYPRHHHFSRVVDPNTNNLDVDLAAVNSLINQRVLARKNKDFRTADSIVNKLLERHAVIINDTDNTWKTGTKRQVKKRPKISLTGTQNTNTNSHSYSNHGYKISPNAGPNTSTLTDQDVIHMICDRRQAQRDRDFKEADSIRHHLKVAGVYVEDGLKEWRADGVPFGGAVGSHRGHASTSPTSLVQSEHSQALDNHVNDNDDDGDTTTLTIVNGLLAKRQTFKSGGNYEKADSIRDKLFETYNIRIDDRLGEWSVGGTFGDDNHASHWATTTSSEQSRCYEKSTASQDRSSADEVYIQAKVDERMRAKRTRNYDLSDSIRDHLFREFDVTIHDKINEWSVGGDFGEGNAWTHVELVETNKKEMADGHGGELDATLSFESYYANQDSSAPPEDILSVQGESAKEQLSEEQMACLTVVQLKEKLRHAGKKVSGTKQELITRLYSL